MKMAKFFQKVVFSWKKQGKMASGENGE